MRRLLVTALLALAACPKAPEAVVTPPPPPPPPNQVPPGCELNLSGTYKLQDDASFRYDVSDDGNAIHVRAFRQFGATRQDINSPAAVFELHRTPEGVRGAATTQAPTLSGAKTCTVLFPYEFTACVGTTVTFRTVQQVKLGEDCKPEDPLHPDFVEHVLVRVPPPDAGAATPPAALIDAGPAPAPTDAGAPIAAPIDAGPSDAGAAPIAAPVDAGTPGPVDAGALIDAGVVTQSVDAGAVGITAP
ncbi:MAG: hypothetical protein JST54_05500 [Deltaproteobacteria bacterium]|nr:hypothetical protein [Deltaproteobacteria bacterium]